MHSLKAHLSKSLSAQATLETLELVLHGYIDRLFHVCRIAKICNLFVLMPLYQSLTSTNA